jgi:hypothetical protein
MTGDWVAPLASGDGVSRDTLRAAGQHIGAELPAALREAYLLFDGCPDLTARQDRLVPPRELGLDDSGTTVVFRFENQYCAEWGVAAADLASADPVPCAWLQAAVFALLWLAAQGAGVRRWSRTMATASRWVSLEPAKIA